MHITTGHLCQPRAAVRHPVRRSCRYTTPKSTKDSRAANLGRAWKVMSFLVMMPTDWIQQANVDLGRDDEAQLEDPAGDGDGDEVEFFEQVCPRTDGVGQLFERLSSGIDRESDAWFEERTRELIQRGRSFIDDHWPHRACRMSARRQMGQSPPAYRNLDPYTTPRPSVGSARVAGV